MKIKTATINMNNDNNQKETGESEEELGEFFIVATPIGNLDDITLRALKILREVDFIACEDTRVSSKLLTRYEIKKPLISYHSHSGQAKHEAIIERLERGESGALISDAGTPTISDPGVLLVSNIRQKFGARTRVIPIPGASAIITALSASGLPSSDFLFLGFLPHKKGRETLFREITESKRTVCFYESPHRILKTLNSLNEHMPDRQIVLGRELTKIHEEFLTGCALEILETLENKPEKVRGEFVVIVSAAS